MMMPGPGGNVGMPPHIPVPMPQQPMASQPMQQPQQSHAAAEPVDPVTKFKILVPHLKEALQKVMTNAAVVFTHNAQFDIGKSSANVSSAQRFDKSLEEFYSICDQVELNLKLALEVLGINSDVQRNVVVQPAHGGPGQTKFPGGAQAPTGAASTDLQTYTQFQSMVKVQVACAKEIHDVLLDCARRISDKQTTS